MSADLPRCTTLLTPRVAACSSTCAHVGDVEAALSAQLGPIRSFTLVGTGTATTTHRCVLSDGSVVFVKSGTSALSVAMLSAEIDGLRALAMTQTVRVPAIAASGEAWIAMEYLEHGRSNASSWRALGADLAALHRVQGSAFGWHQSNFIGTVTQDNETAPSWSEFWNARRLQPLLDLRSVQACIDNATSARLQSLRHGMTDTLAAGDDEGPSMLHGDLWSGNAFVLMDGGAAVIDPSCYYGHREVDLAMAALFGGFSDAFFKAYSESFPLKPGWERRRAIYQLYYLLAHLAMFGRSYVSSVERALAEAGY